jgi:hypothetical protein
LWIRGLFAGFDDFGDLTPAKERTDLRRSTEISMRSSWLGYSLTNYVSATSLQFLSGRLEKIPRDQRERTDEGNYVVSALTEDVASSQELASDIMNADFVFNSRNLFFIHRPNSRYRLYQRRHRLGHIVGKPREEGSGQIGEVLSAHTFHDGIVVETFDRVHLITPTGSQTIHNGAAIKVRTFPSGRNCRNIIAVVDEIGIHLISPLPPEVRFATL